MDNHYKIGDIVNVMIKINNSSNRIATCKINNIYKKNNTNYYSVQEINGIYKCSNLKENRLLQIQ